MKKFLVLILCAVLSFSFNSNGCMMPSMIEAKPNTESTTQLYAVENEQSSDYSNYQICNV